MYNQSASCESIGFVFSLAFFRSFVFGGTELWHALLKVVGEILLSSRAIKMAKCKRDKEHSLSFSQFQYVDDPVKVRMALQPLEYDGELAWIQRVIQVRKGPGTLRNGKRSHLDFQ